MVFTIVVISINVAVTAINDTFIAVVVDIIVAIVIIRINISNSIIIIQIINIINTISTSVICSVIISLDVYGAGASQTSLASLTPVVIVNW